ncbi:MAG TPA: hypothetical protein VM734_04915 [Kofleriaceae bacterium]|nr:hypothetical protein [Kofleriaceae bacterium]
MTDRWPSLLARGLAIAAPLGAGALGLAAPDSVLWGGAGWLVFLVAVLAGWGHLLARLVKADDQLDLGLRLAWGAAALLTVSAVLMAVGRLDLRAFQALIAIGSLGYAWRHASLAEPAVVTAAREAGALVRRDPQVALVWAALAALALVNVLGAVVHLDPNVYDDDIAYTPFVKRLLDAGNLDEPFSFRRISAFGGQTVLSALAGVRGTLANIYLVDHGVFQLVTLALVAGYVRRPESDRFAGGALLLTLLLLPDASINTASYWSGTALFLGLFRTIAHVDLAPGRLFAVAGLLAAATCSLRQNYLPVAIGFVGLSLLFRLRRPLLPAFRADRAAWLGALIGTLVGLAPFAIASWRSNQTVLYPLQLGTFNPNIQMTPELWTLWQELQFFVNVLLAPDPVRIAVPLIPILFLLRDHRRGRPVTAFTVACIVGFLLLVHSFTLADARNLWRYAFGFATTLTIVLTLEGTARRAEAALPAAARFWVIAALLVQLGTTTKGTVRKYKDVGADLGAAARTHRRPHADVAVPALYRRLQATVPAGAPLVVMLDQPAYLDYARNDIINLDTPGYASFAPGLPFFRGAEPVAAYFRSHGLRYLAFVRGDHSRYFYRRQFWLDRLLKDVEIWRIEGAYLVDAIDNLTELAQRYPVLHEEAGMVLVDLAAPRGAP